MPDDMQPENETPVRKNHARRGRSGRARCRGARGRAPAFQQEVVHHPHLFGLRAEGGGFFRSEAAGVGPIVALRMGPVKAWVVTDADAARTMLVSESASWTRPPATLVPIRMGVGENLFTQSDKAWARLQPSVAPAFRKKALESRLADIGRADRRRGACDPTRHDGRPRARDGPDRVAPRRVDPARRTARRDPGRGDRSSSARGRRLGRRTARPGSKGILPVAFGARGREMKRHRAVLNAYADEVIARAHADAAHRRRCARRVAATRDRRARRSRRASSARTCSASSSPATRPPRPRCRGPS